MQRIKKLKLNNPIDCYPSFNDRLGHLCNCIFPPSDYTNVRQQRRGEENATIIYGNDFDENVDEAEDEDADDESDANFQQEFDVESGSEEEERPPQVESALTPCASLGHLLRVSGVSLW